MAANLPIWSAIKPKKVPDTFTRSKWSYSNGSDALWELESEDGYPSLVKWATYSQPIADSVPVGKPRGFTTYNKIEWQEDDYGKYPKRLSSSQVVSGTVVDGLPLLLDAEFKLDVNNKVFRDELAKVKKRLVELQNRKLK